MNWRSKFAFSQFAKTFMVPMLLLSAPVSAQSIIDRATYNRALAAGYKAQFICSGLWNGGKTLADIEADELSGIYDRISAIVPTLDANIDQEKRQVRVPYDDEAFPRIAVWHHKNGCVGLPIGSDGTSTGNPFTPRTFADNRPWPMGDEDAASTDRQLSAAALPVTRQAFDAKTYGANSKTSAVVIMKGGHIVAEQYKAGHDLHTAQRTWSVAKSLAGTLIGHSVQQGFSEVDAPVNIIEWMKYGDPRAKITLDNLMRMASGLTSDTAGNRTDPIYMGGASVTERATAWPLLYKPGSQFRYANNDTLLAVHAARSGAFDPHAFFQKLGMTRTYAETDWQGNYILSSQVWTTARDLGRLGLLYLNNGEWMGERLLPENWRAYVSAPSGPQPNRPFGYGATFWLMNRTEGVPADTFAGFGNRGQYLVIIPSLDIVIVRRGYDTRESRFDIAAFTRDIVAALD